MKNAAKELIRFALSRNNTVSVHDGEEWQLKRSNKYRAIIDAIASVDEAQIRIRHCEGPVLAWARVTLFGVAADETVIDCSDNTYMEEFDATINA